MGAEGQPWAESAVQIQIQMVVPDEVQKVGGAQVVFLLAQGVLKVKVIHAELVGHDDIAVIGNPAGDPVVAADGLHPPDFLRIGEGNAVGFVGAVRLQEAPKPEHALPGGMNVGQHHSNKVLLTQAAGDGLASGAGLVRAPKQGIGGLHPGVGGDGFRGGHGHVFSVDTPGAPDSVAGVHTGGDGVAQGILGEGQCHAAELGFVGAGLILGQHHRQALLVKEAVVIAGDHGGAVEAGFFAYQNGCTGHGVYSLVCRLPVFRAAASVSMLPRKTTCLLYRNSRMKLESMERASTR